MSGGIFAWLAAQGDWASIWACYGICGAALVAVVVNGVRAHIAALIKRSRPSG